MEVRRADVKDYPHIYRFLSNNYECENYFNWDVGRLCFTRFAVNNEENSRGFIEWIKDVYLWLKDEEIVGMVHTEEPGDYFIQVAQANKNLEKEMIEYIMQDAKRKIPERKSIIISTDERDDKRISLLELFGGKKLSDVDTLRLLKTDECEVADIQSEFRVSEIDATNATFCQKISEVYRYVWPESSYVPNGDVVKNLLENSDGFETLSWAVCKGDSVVAYAMGFVDANHTYVHLYPIAICQEYLDTQALDIMLEEITREVKGRNIKYSVINAWYKPEENRKFSEHGYLKEHHNLFYEIPIIKT
ncbi:MAG: hypothetical protein IJO97_07620 [Lachnospiraceae bacterium]|nr:hypothetical protein [Lachnospiraceae bacterium]